MTGNILDRLDELYDLAADSLAEMRGEIDLAAAQGDLSPDEVRVEKEHLAIAEEALGHLRDAIDLHKQIWGSE